MTILSTLQSCCYRWNIPFPGAGTIFGNTDPHARQLLHILYAVSEELRQAACWTQQKKIHTFNTSSGRDKYPLPEDFYKASPFTHWNNTENRRLIGPLPDFDFTARLYGEVGSSINFEYRIFGPDSNPNTSGGQFVIYPTPTSTIECSFEYLTKNLFLPKNWLPSTAYTIGTYVNANGNIYLCDTNGTSSTTPPSGTSQNITDGTTRWDYVSAPYETVLADTDLCLFEEALIKIGVRAKWRDEKGEEADKAEREFRSKIDKAVSSLQGISTGSFTKVGTMLPRYSYPRTFI